MQRIFLLIAIMCFINVYASEVDIIEGEAALQLARTQGKTVYYGCIVTPPATPAQNGVCATEYAIYIAALQFLNKPFPLALTTKPSLYLWSPYDICRFETSHFVFPEPGVPACPA